jgi:predicted Rossmann-fold nucleotide-binding protein
VASTKQARKEMKQMQGRAEELDKESMYACLFGGGVGVMGYMS